MDASDKYLSFPLALLRAASSEVLFFRDAADYAAVNAGTGYAKLYGHEDLKALARSKQQTKTDILFAHGIVGAHLCGMQLGDRSGKSAHETFLRVQSLCVESPKVRVSSKWFWIAAQTANGEQEDRHQISWDEFRVLVAILSGQVNRDGFTLLGWEAIQYRACGFHRKSDFKEFLKSGKQWPPHCLPLGRKAIRNRLNRLESLKFFLRHRISKGERGGYTAYSFRHSTGSEEQRRHALAADCEKWQAFNQGLIVEENRAKDALMHACARAKRVEDLLGVKQATKKAKEAIKESIRRGQHQHRDERQPTMLLMSLKGPCRGQPGAKVGTKVGTNITINSGRNAEGINAQEKHARFGLPPETTTDQRTYKLGETLIPAAQINEFVAKHPERLMEIADNARHSSPHSTTLPTHNSIEVPVEA